MKIVICENYADMSKKAAEAVAAQIKTNPSSVLGFATGSTPIGLYENLVGMYNEKKISFKDITTFNLDEYYPIDDEDEQSYHYFMKENLFGKVDLDPSKIHFPSGKADNPVAECAAYENAIAKSGGIDLQILGIGRNGHIGFNEPDASLNTKTHITDLTSDTIDANSRFFDSKDSVPTRALTMGISTILGSKKIILLASGRSKHAAIAGLLSNEITTSNPSTMLKLHPDVTLICDIDAFYDVKVGVDIGGMSVKMGVVVNGKIIDRKNVAVNASSTGMSIADAIGDTCKTFMSKYSVGQIGIGTPGIIKNGRITAANLPFDNFDLGGILAKKLKVPVKIENDANCAALGEVVSGAGAGADNMILVTLGTGVGAGIIINKHIYSGTGAAGEVGHMIINEGGEECPCGSKGCFERYASVTALINQTAEAANENPGSILAECAKDGVGGKTLFEAMRRGCTVAEAVFDRYTDYLATGLNNLIKLFAPQMILISGGISNEGDTLIAPLQKKLGNECVIKTAELKNDAGIIGAAAL